MPESKGYNIKPNLKSKAAKYFFAKTTIPGMTKAKAALIAGYSNPTQVAAIENTQSYKVIAEKYKDVLEKRISVEKIVNEHAKVIEQDQELGPKVAAIKIAMDSIEKTETVGDEDEKISVVLRD